MDGMQSIQEFLAHFGNPNHIEGDAGDFVGEDGRLHCGKCGTTKEFIIPMSGRYVRSMCRCEREAKEAWERERQEAEEMDRVRALQRYSIYDARTREARFEAAEIRPDSAEAFRIARAYVKRWDEMFARKDGVNGLMFYGRPGSGKSYLAACIANALMDRRVPVLMTSIVKLTDAPRERVSEVLDKAQSARLLVLDDLGAERDTSFRLEQVFNVIDRRYASKRPMIVTTNLSQDDIKNGVDPRYNRIFERVKAMCYPIRLDGASWRQRQAAKGYGEVRRELGVRS